MAWLLQSLNGDAILEKRALDDTCFLPVLEFYSASRLRRLEGRVSAHILCHLFPDFRNYHDKCFDVLSRDIAYKAF